MTDTYRLAPSVQDIVDQRMQQRFKDRLYASDLTPVEAGTQEQVLHAEVEAAVAASVVADKLGVIANGRDREYLIQVLAIEHPTLLGQIMAAVSMAVAPVRDDVTGYCDRSSPRGIFHAPHDGRITCETAIGATLARHQPVI